MSQHHRPTDHRRRTGLAAAVLAVAALTTLGASAPAFAAKGGGSGGVTSTSSLALVLLSSPVDGLPHWGQQVKFDVSTTATTEPHVSLKCYQSSTLVYTTQTGYYASYPWPWTQTMTLASDAWTGGAADCNAVLYYFSGTKTVKVTSLVFHVEP